MNDASHTLTTKRNTSIDLIKGIIIVLMCLDHTRTFFHYSAYHFNPTNVSLSSLPVFLTRWITHFCEPIFCITAGLSAFYLRQRMDVPTLSNFLIKRGIWLIVADLTLINFGWHFDPRFQTLLLGVFWMLGWSMIILSALIYLPRKALLILCVSIIAGHQLLDQITSSSFTWTLLHRSRFIHLTTIDRNIWSGDPLIPWSAVMGLGYGLGTVFLKDTRENRNRLMLIGVLSLTTFFLLRLGNAYGDPGKFRLYSGQSDKSLMSFLNVTKSPPSVQFLLLTLGSFFLITPLLSGASGWLSRKLSVFGRVPFFFYVLHIYAIHLAAMAWAAASGYGWRSMVVPLWVTEQTELKKFGFSLPVVYAIWIALIICLYPVCSWYDKYKRKHRHLWWLHYL